MLGELRQLKAFLAIARLGNFTRAAHELHISQSALSVQIRQLENGLGVTLFDRNRRRVTMTQSGIELLPRFEALVQDMDALITDARDSGGPTRGVVTVAALPSVAASVLPAAMRELATSHPGISLRVRDSAAVRVIELCKSGAVDFGIGCIEKNDRDLVIEPLHTDQFCAVVAATHALANRKVLSLGELARQRLLLPVRDSSIRVQIEKTAAQANIDITAAYEAAFNSTLIAMAREGLGVAVLSELVVRHDDSRSLVSIPIRRPVVQRDIVVIASHGRPMSRAARIVADALRKVV
ncbi:LysR family transcriptional regulator [Achromobacter deleyi]|uniref:LysR family transcriptional regulator n=1 Tax=Achromobacter deleyi TaxID=1353891 RepID=UPI001490F0AF|nr:LysR family transcriptional regulator [Achromobacter deleyi]QVQ26277.1 LysR family transcriptional regulator [Achromobacter deleyi]UIP21839.1 LysR family transcriptional regulator [Achromobacter deleyi]